MSAVDVDIIFASETLEAVLDVLRHKFVDVFCLHIWHSSNAELAHKLSRDRSDRSCTGPCILNPMKTKRWLLPAFPIFIYDQLELRREGECMTYRAIRASAWVSWRPLPPVPPSKESSEIFNF